MTHTQVYLDHLEPFLKFLKKVPWNVARKVPSFRVFQNPNNDKRHRVFLHKNDKRHNVTMFGVMMSYFCFVHVLHINYGATFHYITF